MIYGNKSRKMNLIKKFKNNVFRNIFSKRKLVKEKI